MKKIRVRRVVVIAVSAGVFLAPERQAQAQGNVPSVDVAQTVTRDYNVEAQLLESALPAFARQAGRQITADAAVVQGLSSPGVKGTMSFDEAISRLLAGTGLTYSVVNGTTISVYRQGQSSTSGGLQLDPVQVQGVAAPSQAVVGNSPPPYAGGQVTTGSWIGLLGNRDYMNTPYSVTTYTEKVIKDQQAVTLIDVLQVDPTVRTTYSNRGLDDRIDIRGFQITPRNFSFNGLFNVLPETTIGMAGIERVEVLRGPTAMLLGMSPLSAVGGTVNMIAKRAPERGLTEFTARYLSPGQAGGQIDVGRRFVDNRLGVRANVAFLGGATPYYAQTDNLFEATLGVDFRADNVRVDFDVGYQNRYTVAPLSGAVMTAGVQVPAPPPNYTNFNMPWGYEKTNTVYGMMSFEYDFAPNLTGFIKAGGRHYERDGLTGNSTITNVSGAYNPQQQALKINVDAFSGEAGIRGTFNTWGVAHDFAMSGNYTISQTAQRRGAGGTGIPSSNIYFPIYGPSSAALAPLLPPAPQNQVLQTGFGVIDAMSFMGDKLQVIGGIRAQNIATTNYNANGQITAATPGNLASAVTPTAGIVVRPWKELMFYGNYIEALEQGPVAPAGTLNVGTAFPAFVSKQFEVGAKLDLKNFGATLSAFSITRPSSYTTGTNIFVVDGQQRNNGIEFTMFGEPLPGLRPLAGFTLINGVQTNTLNGTNNGKIAPGVAPFQAKLGVEYDVPMLRGFTLGSQLTYVSPVYVDAANLSLAPAWTRVDMSAKYVFERADGKPVALRANIYNVGDTNYWNAQQSVLFQGTPRTFMLSLTAEF